MKTVYPPKDAPPVASKASPAKPQAPKPAAPQYFWSQGKRSFYHTSLHNAAQIPADAVKLDPVQYQQLRDGRASGKDIVMVGDRPALVERVYPPAVKTANVRATRDEALRATDLLTMRYNEQALADLPTTLTKDQFKALAAYRQALRNLPAAAGFPDVPMPEAPDFLKN